MASIVLRRASASNLLGKLLQPVRAVSVTPSASRSFNTESQMRRYDDEDRGVDIDRSGDTSLSRRRDFPTTVFSDVLDPFNPSMPTSLSQVMNMMDRLMDNPLLSASRGMGAAGSRRGWDAKEDENALYLRIDMPGLGKEDVKVTVEQNTLIIRGEGTQESEDEESGRRYTSRIDLPEKIYKTDEIKAEMKNGVLKVIVPKVKEEERKDVRQVSVE